MTNRDFRRSLSDIQKTVAAFAVERQMLIPELSPSVVEDIGWKIEDKEKIAAGLLLCLSFLIGQTIGDVKIEGLDRIYPPGRNQGLIDFKLICLIPDRVQVNLGICILPFSDFEVVNEACTRLLVYKDFGLDCLCLLRQKDLMTNVRQLPVCLPKLLSTDIGGNFVPLKPKDLLSIITTLSVFQNKRQYGITNEMIFTYLQREELLTKNELIKSILVTAKF